MNTTLISRFMLQLNYQKRILLPALASPEKAPHLPEMCVESSLLLCLISSEELFAEDDSPPGQILSELPRPGWVWFNEMGGIIRCIDVPG